MARTTRCSKMFRIASTPNVYHTIRHYTGDTLISYFCLIPEQAKSAAQAMVAGGECMSLLIFQCWERSQARKIIR